MLFNTNPVTVNNGTDHILVSRGQINDSKVMGGIWIEPAAAPSKESTVVVKHDEKSVSVRRRLLQRKAMYATTTRGMRPITCNFTTAYDVEHSLADVKLEILFTLAVLNATAVIDNYLLGMM